MELTWKIRIFQLFQFQIKFFCKIGLNLNPVGLFTIGKSVFYMLFAVYLWVEWNDGM